MTNMPQNYKQMTEQEFDALMGDVEEGHMGEEIVYACNASPHDHIHVRRIGCEHTNYSRLGVFAHGPTGMVTLFLSPADARSLAEHLNSIAEDIDGQTVSYDVPDDLASLMGEQDGNDDRPEDDD